MNAYYHWLPDGPEMPSYDEEHAQGKIREVYPEARFERRDEPGEEAVIKLVALVDGQPVAVIWRSR